MAEPRAVPMVRFGVFRFDPVAGELWKHNRRLRLQEQPRQVLALLIDRRDALVTREVLKQRLWPADTFVDYEHGLNAAIRRLRHVLGDTADAAWCIETVPRRGYRFIAVVEPSEDAAPAPSAGAPPGDQSGVTDVEVTPTGPTPVPVDGWRLIWRLAPAAALVIVVLGGTAAYLTAWLWSSPPAVVGPPAAASARLLTQVTFDYGLTTEPALSPDGRVLAYAADRGREGDLDLWTQREGSAAVRLTHDPSDDHEPSFSPDGDAIVFRSERNGGGVYIMPAHSGGQERLLAAGGHTPRFSPDGRWVTYWTIGNTDVNSCGVVSGMNRVFVVPADGGSPRPVAAGFAAACWPIWAPDSRHILVIAKPSATTGFGWFVLPIDGGPPIDLGSDLHRRYAFAHWPRLEFWQGNRVVFSVWRHSPKNLWMTHIDPVTWKASDVALELTASTVDQGSASAALDGQVAFAAVDMKRRLWSLPINADTGQRRGAPEALTAGVLYDWMPTLSADGMSLCFWRYSAQGNAVGLRDGRTGDVRTRLPPGQNWWPAMSPDGARIAYVGREGADTVLRVIGTEGGEPERVLTCGGCQTPAWSHDNRRLLFVDDRKEFTIRMLNLETGRAHLVAARAGHSLSRAVFAPDDRWVLFVDKIGDRSQVFAALLGSAARPVESDHWIPLTGDSDGDDTPQWSPSGSIVYFTSRRDGFKCVWAQRLDPVSRQRRGAPFSVFHAHGATISLGAIQGMMFNIAVAADRLVFNGAEQSGNIWVTRLDPAR